MCGIKQCLPTHFEKTVAGAYRADFHADFLFTHARRAWEFIVPRLGNRASLINSFIHSLINSAVCLTTGPQALQKRVLHTVRSSASSFNFQYPLVSLGSSSSWLRLLPRLPVTSIPPSIVPSIIGRSYARCGQSK